MTACPLDSHAECVYAAGTERLDHAERAERDRKDEGMGELKSAISRREALKLSAKTAGVAAFATPVVVGAFSSPAMASHGGICTPGIDSDAETAVLGSGGSYNVNCGTAGPLGRYNGQNGNFTLADGTEGEVLVGFPGVDNFDVRCSFYTIDVPGFVCSATFDLLRCDCEVLFSSPCDETLCPTDPDCPANAQPLPYCACVDCSGGANVASVRLRLASVTCCPV